MNVITLNREDCLNSMKKIEDYNSLKFSKQAIEYWDNFISWENFPPLCLIDENKKHLSYLFYHISKNNEYLTIHHLLTPKKHRHKNYAYELLEYLFDNLKNNDIDRFKLYCVTSSLGFYNSIGLEYWGINELSQFYCDFKMPKNSIKEIPQIVKMTNLNELSDERLEKIFDKLKNNGKNLNDKEQFRFNEALEKIKYKYHFDLLSKKIDEINS